MTDRTTRERERRKRERRRFDRTAAQRMRRWRARQRDGRIVLRLEVNEVDVTEGLVEFNLLDPMKTEDPQAVATALEKFIDDAFRVTT